jgi:hypothetical protein
MYPMRCRNKWRCKLRAGRRPANAPAVACTFPHDTLAGRIHQIYWVWPCELCSTPLTNVTRVFRNRR